MNLGFAAEAGLLGETERRGVAGETGRRILVLLAGDFAGVDAAAGAGILSGLDVMIGADGATLSSDIALPVDARTLDLRPEVPLSTAVKFSVLLSSPPPSISTLLSSVLEKLMS